MTNSIIDLARAICTEQNKPRDETKETDEQYHGRVALEVKWPGNIRYCGNSIGWTHSKAVNYGRELQKAWDELRKLGIHPDGNTTVAQAIVRLSQQIRTEK